MWQRIDTRHNHQAIHGCCIWAVGILSEDSTSCDYLLATSTLLILIPLLTFFGRVVSVADFPYGCECQTVVGIR